MSAALRRERESSRGRPDRAGAIGPGGVGGHTEQGRPETGARTVADILSQLEPLADLPDLGRVVPEFSHPLLRELVRPPFRIVYRREPAAVRILRVWRSERLLQLPPDE